MSNENTVLDAFNQFYAKTEQSTDTIFDKDIAKINQEMATFSQEYNLQQSKAMSDLAQIVLTS